MLTKPPRGRASGAGLHPGDSVVVTPVCQARSKASRRAEMGLADCGACLSDPVLADRASDGLRPLPQSQSDQTSISRCSGVSACRKAWESKTAPGDWAPLLGAVAPSRIRSTASHTSGAVKA